MENEKDKHSPEQTTRENKPKVAKRNFFLPFLKFAEKNYMAIWFFFALGVVTYCLLFNKFAYIEYTKWTGENILFLVWLILLFLPLVKELNIGNIFGMVTKSEYVARGWTVEPHRLDSAVAGIGQLRR